MIDHDQVTIEVMKHPELFEKFMLYAKAPEKEKPYFRFVKYKDTGRVDIIDERHKMKQENSLSIK